MPESSVKITLGVQLDKSEIDKQLQEMQKELDAYKLKIGVDREQLTQDTGSGQSTEKSSPKSFESPGNEEEIDFGVLSDLANEKFNETFGLIDIANDNLIEILGEVKAIRGALDGLSPVSTTKESEQVSPASTNSILDAAVKESGEKITNQLTDIVTILSTISTQLSEKKDLSTFPSRDLSGETSTSASRPLPRANQSISEDSTDIVPLVQDAIDKISTNINQATDSLSSEFAISQEIVDIANDSFPQLVTTTKSIIESVVIDIIKVVTNSLDEALTEIQDSVFKLLQNILTDLVKEISNSISNDSQNNNKKRGGEDNSGSTISSGISSLISVIVRLQEVLTDQLGKITGQLFPEIITQLQFDFFKSLIGGAVERLGAVLINQSAGGAAKLAEGVVTGNVFRQSDPAAAATMAFGEGFAANDPGLLGSELSKISKKLDVLNPAIAEPNTQPQIDSAPEVETVRMTAVLETIAGNISASNIILDKIVVAIEASDTGTNEQQLLEGTTEIIKMTATLESVADRINTTNQLLGEIQSEISLISFDGSGQSVLGGSSDNLLPAATDYTDVSFEDIVAQVLPSTPIEIPDIDPDKLVNNFTRIITDVFKEVGISAQKVADKGRLPKLNVVPDEKLKAGSKYNRSNNTISVSESTAKDLSSENDISKDSFLAIVKELRKAIQSSFTGTDYKDKVRRAGKGTAPISRIPLQTKEDLIDRTKEGIVEHNILNANERDRTTRAEPDIRKGLEALNTDAEVFAQNLADKLFSTPIDIPEIEQLFKAPSSGNKSKDSKDDVESLLTGLIQSSDESNVLLREGIQRDRTNIDRLSGDKFVNESSSQLGGDPASNKIEGIVNEIKGFGASFNKDFSNIFDTRLKDFAINASKAVGVPDTGWVDNVTNFVQYLDIFANLLKTINPALADSFGNVREKVVNDSVRFASQGMEGVARKGTEFYDQVRSNPNLQRDSIANRINQGRDFIGAAKDRVMNAIPFELISQGRDVVGAAKNRVMNAIPPELISQLQSIQQQLNETGAIDTLRAVLEKANNVGGQLIGTIGQLINSLGNLINSGESVPAVKDFLENVQSEISTRGKGSNDDSLFRADIPPSIWDVNKTSPEFAFDAPDSVNISSMSTAGDSLMDLPDPWAETEKPGKGNDQRPSSEDSNKQDKVQVDLVTFIQKALPIAVAGLVVAKLGTSLLNNVLPGKSNIERKVSVDSLQSTLTKALIGAVTVAIGQKLVPQLSKFFAPDKSVTLIDRIKSVFSNTATVPPESQPTPYADLSADELDKLIAGLQINNSSNVSSLDNSGFLPLERLSPLDDLFRNPIRDEPSTNNSSTQKNKQEKGQADSPTFIQKSLPMAIAGLVVAKLGTSLLNKALPGRASVERRDSVNNLQSTLTKGLIAAISVAKLTNAPLLPKKGDIPDISRLGNSNLPKAIGVAVAAALSARFIGSTVKSIRGGDRQESLGEKLIKGLFERLTNQTRNRGRQIDEKFAGYSGKKRTSGDNGDIPSVGMFETLLSKLPVLLTGLIIGRLIADVVPKIVDGLKQGSADSNIDSIDLSQKPSLISRGENKTDIKETITPSQASVDLDAATKLAQQVAKDSGLSGKEQKVAEQDFIDLYLSNPQALKEASAKNSENNSATTETERMNKSFKAIADEVFRVSGLSPSKIDEAGLFPGVRVDSGNKLKGASSYTAKNNEVTLSSDIAKMLSSSEGVSKEAFITIAHELRHAMQLAFGKSTINSTAAIAQENSFLPIGKNSKIDLKTERNLIDPSKAEQISKQTKSSMAMTQPSTLSKGLKSLEVDAEVFAQNLADVFYGLNEKLPDTLFRANISNSDKSINPTNLKEKSISSLDKGIKDLGKTYKTMSSQATNPNLANLVTIDIPDIVSREIPDLLDTSLLSSTTELPSTTDTSLPLSTIALNNQQDEPSIAVSSDTGDKGQTILQAIKVSVERIIILLDNIAAQLGASVNTELNLGAESMSTIDSLYRGVTEDSKKTKKEQGGEKEKTRAVIIGEKIGTKLENAIDNMQSRLNKKMQDAGMSEDEIRGIADQAGGYMFANLSAFFPAGAMGVALAPVIASLSALGIPIAAAIGQLAPIGQMLADTMRTMTPIQTRFETIGGNPENGQQMLDFAAQVAQEYNTPLLASIEGFSRLAAASKGSKLEGQDTEELFKGVSQAMAALGLNAQDASLIFLAFQQVISKGKVAAEELRGQIGERLPGAIQLAAKSLGMTVADFSATLDRGEISANILLPKLAKAFQEEYGAGAKAASQGFLGTLNKIENSLFNFRRLMTDEFGGIVAGVAKAAATALDAVLWLMDNVLLKSGLMFNAILGIQAQIVAGTAFIFSKLDLPMALAKALSGGYGKMSLVLIPFVFGLFQEIIGMVLAKVLGVEVNNAIQMLTGFFSTLVGRVIQTYIDLSKDPKQFMEGLVNIIRSVSIGVKNAAESFLNFGIAIQTSIGLGVDQVSWLIKKLGDAEKLINKVADNSIGKIYAPQIESPQGAAGSTPNNNEQGFASMFNGKAIARLSIEFFSLFTIMIQTMILLRIIGEQALKAGEAFKVFGGKFMTALMSMKTGKSILSMLTLGFSGLNLLLAGLATLVVLMAFKSSSTNSFLSQLSNSVKALEGLNTNLDNLANKKIEITTKFTQLDQEGVRDTPFQDKGLVLTPWRAREQEQFTTDDIRRMIQKRIDSTAYRRDLPLLPDNFSESRGSLFDQGNLSGLGNVLASQVGQENQPTSFDELISLKDKLEVERKTLEDYLTLNLQLDVTNTFDELTRLKSELGDVDSELADVQQKREKLGKGSSIGQVFTQGTNALRGEGNLPSFNDGLVETVKLFRDISKYAPGLGGSNSGVSAVPGAVTNLLIGAESIDYAETEMRLNQRRAELQSQINSFEQQRALNPGSDTMTGLTPLEAQIETLKKELNTIDGKLNNLSFPTLGNDATADSFVITNKDKLLRRRESIAKSIEELEKVTSASVDDFAREIREKSRRIEELTIPSATDGKTAKKEKARQIETPISKLNELVTVDLQNPDPSAREITSSVIVPFFAREIISQLAKPREQGTEIATANSKEITALTDEVTLLLFQRKANLAANKREELARVNQDLRAIQTFASTPGVFNNAFNQDDTVLREMVSQQLDVFSMVQNEQINPQRLNEGNLISVLPELQRDVQQERDLTANRIREIEEEIAQLDTTGEGAKDRLVALNKELKSFNNRLIGLKGLNRFLDISQSYADLGAGKQELQNTRIARSLTRLSQALKDNPVQSEALQQFQQSPTLPNLAQLEQSILIDLVPARQAVTRAKSERENIATTPLLRTEQDLRSAGYVTKEQKQQLDVFRALEESVQREIQSARKTVAEAYSDYNQATAEGLDFQPALDNYYAVGEQLKELQTQLQELRTERDAFLDEVKTVAPPIQVDDTAREQRLAEVDQVIKDAEYRVNELAKQFQLIQETKSGLGGLGQLGENLDVAAAKLREPLRGFAAVWEFVTTNRGRGAKAFNVASDALNPALETVGGFINQQQNLSGGARAGLVGGLNSGDYAMTKTALESINIQDGKILFNGEELTGTDEEIRNFTEALKTATRVLDFIGNQSNNGSRPVQQAIEEAFGIKTVDTQRAEISNQYFSQIASLATSGIFSDSQLMGLTQDGLKLADAQKILDEVKNRDGLTNFQSVIETMQDNGATPGEIRDVLNSLQGLEQTFANALALDPRGATRVRLGTVGEEEYTQTVGKLDQIQELAAKSSEKLGLQYYDGNINTWMTALKDVKPGFLENIQQLRTIEEELTRLGQKRIEVNEQLTRTDLSKEQRKNLTAQATQLDEDFKIKYREKKVAGADLTEAFTFYQAAEKELSLLAEEIEKSDLSQQIKDSLLAMIKQAEKGINPGVEALKQFEDLMSLSGEEALEAAGKSITRALENFEKIAKQIDFVTQQKLADITTALLEFSSNKELAITDLDKSVAGLVGDPEKLAAEQNLAIAQVNAQQSFEKLTAARKTKEDVDRDVEISLQKAAFSPNESLKALELAQEKQIEALNAFSQAQEEYSQNIKALTEAQLARIEADTQIPVRISQFNSKQKNINYKQQRLDGVLKESDVTKLQVQDEIGVLDIEIAATAARLESIAKGIKDSYITNIDLANKEISELIDKQQDLTSNRLDKLLELENEERERSIKLLENQSSLSAKYFDVAINGYELLNKETERYTKQLDNLTQIGEQLKTLSQAQFQFNIGRGETASSLIDAGVGARERLSSEDLSPRQRSFQTRRLGALQQLGQGYGIQPAAFGMNEDAALAEQQKIATKLAKEKLDAMEKEQAISSKLLDIEIQRNQIAAEMALREAEIGKLRAEQAVIQAQFGLQQAILGKDPTAIKLAELEVQIAASQQGLANAELGAANDNLALQALFAQMQREASKLDSASARDGLISEVAGNENVDIASILQSLKNFKNFDPANANPREVFAPYLDWLNKQTPQRDPNTPIGLPLEAFNGDTQAWIDANVAIAKQQQEQASAQTPPEVQSLKNVFDKIFGEPVASKIDMSNGKVQDISKEIAILDAGRLGEKVAPTQEMIDSVSGQREIDNALEQARRLAQASEPIDNSRMASDVYSISTAIADATSTFLTIAELLGLIALNTRGGGESTGENKPGGGSESTPLGIEDGGNAYDEVLQMIEELKAARGIKDVLDPIVNETKTEKPWATPLPEILGNLSNQSQSTVLDLSESTLPTVAPTNQQSAVPPSSDTRISAILNPTIQNSVTPRFAAPAVNVSAVAQREPGYFYRNLANEVTPQVAYRIPPGVQATQGATSYQPVQNTTINITNKIDAASQREMYAKIGETQTKAVLSALNKMA
jgi:tape measure domain-containing protein